jgi:hypothetical protein
MSLDARVRETLERSGELIEPPVRESLARVRRRAAVRTVAMRAAAAATVLVGIVLVVLLGPSMARLFGAPVRPQPGGTPGVVAPDPLAGVWTTGSFPCRTAHAVATRAGFGEGVWDRRMCPTAGTMTIGYRFEDGRLLGFNAEGRVHWDGTYDVVDDHTFVADDGFDHGTVDYRFEDGKLHLRLLELTAPTDLTQLRKERLIWTMAMETAPFHRVG